MKLRSFGVAGVSAAALAAVSAATPAIAAPDCGVVPAGATLTVLGGTTCELDFAAAGSYSWTTPDGVQGLQALLLGGGSGAYLDTVGGIGYAGDAGDLIYADLSSAAGSVAGTVVVGDGGATSADQSLVGDGQSSSVTLGGAPRVADGGLQGGGPICVVEGSTTTDTGNGDGSGGFAGGGVCETGYAPGLTPSVDAVGTDGGPRPATFSDITTTFGIGGRVLVTADTLPLDATLDGLGIGANVRYDSVPDNVTEGNAAGGSGRVILRYTIGAVPPAAPTLPAAGLDSAPVIGIAALTAGLGAVLLAVSRRRRQA